MTIDKEEREQVAVDHVKHALEGEFAAEDVDQAVDEARKQYADAPVRDFVPNLIERDAREHLKESD